MIRRRYFILQTGAAALGWLLPAVIKEEVPATVMTINGPIPASALKFTLTHEHILVDFAGAEITGKHRYNAEEVFNTAMPFLSDLKKRGCQTFVDCTPAYLGRDVALLQRLSKASGLNIITNTGYYGAASEKFLPLNVYSDTAEQIAARWIGEWKHGIEGTGIKPGMIKTGVDKAPLTSAQVKVITAAALTHLATGLTIVIHTGNGEAAEAQLSILEQKGVAPSARIWIHAQSESDTRYHITAAKKGSWISFDAVNQGSVKEYVKYLQTMKAAGLLRRVLVSQDSGWYNVGDLKGGDYKDYNFILAGFIPALLQNGFTQKEVDQVFVINPAEALAIRVRKN